MRKLILFAIFLLAPLTVLGQCDTGSVCVKQTTIDAATRVATELVEAREVIARFQAERTATDAERASAGRVIERLNSVIALQDRMTAEYKTVMDMYKSVVQMQSELIDRLTKQLNAPKSAWQKLVATLKTLAAIATGITLGRGL